MSVSSNEFREYLAPDESLVNAVPGTMIDNSYRSKGSIGVTDRRVIFVSDGGRFLAVAYDSICSIRSRPRTTFTARGIGYRFVAIVGVPVAASGFVGVMVLKRSMLAFLLMFLTVGGVVVAEFVRRSGFDVEWSVLGDAWSSLGDAWSALKAGDGRTFEKLDGVEPLRRLGKDANDGGDNEPLVLGIGLVSLSASIGLIGLTESLLVLPLALVSLAGIAWTDYAYRRTRDLDTAEGSRRRERDVSIHLVDGRTVDLRVDATVRIDRELSGSVRGTARKNAVPELTRT